MNVVTLLQPPRIVFGNGCAPKCVELLRERGVRRLLLVSSTPVLLTISSLIAALREAGFSVIQSPPVDAEPTIGMFEAALKVARAEKVEAVLAVGGGSA